MEHKQIGARIKDRRKALGMSATDLATRVNLSKATIHRYENGDIANIKLPVVESIARILLVSPLWLLGRSEDMASEAKLESEGRYLDVEVVLDDVISHIRVSKELLYCGRPISENDRNAIVSSLKMVRRMMELQSK